MIWGLGVLGEWGCQVVGVGAGSVGEIPHGLVGSLGKAQNQARLCVVGLLGVGHLTNAPHCSGINAVAAAVTLERELLAELYPSANQGIKYDLAVAGTKPTDPARNPHYRKLYDDYQRSIAEVVVQTTNRLRVLMAEQE